MDAFYFNKMPKRCDSTLTDYTLEIFRGASCGLGFTCRNPDDSPIDITGSIIRLGIKDIFDSTLKLSSDEAPNSYGSFIEIYDAVNGKFRFVIMDEETETAEVGSGRWWIEKETGGDIRLMWRGSVVADNI